MKLSEIKKDCVKKGTVFLKSEPVNQKHVDAHRKGFCSLGDTLVWMSVNYWEGKVEKTIKWYEIFK